ncbi:MAG: GAF domain-containing protein, partial [Elainellaceae cyanobacterium]
HLSDGCFIEVNDSFLGLTGYSRGEALGRTSIELGLWCDPSDRRDIVENIQKSGAVRNQEIKFRHKDGHVLHTLLSTSVFDIGRQPCLLTVVRDITEWERTQDNLRILAERDRLFAETTIRIHHCLDLEDILEATVTEVRRVLNVDRAFVYQVDRDSSSKIVAESLAQPFPSLLGRAAEIPTHDILKAMETASVVQIDDISQLEDTCPYRTFVQRYETQAAMGAAILVDEILFGVMVVHQCHQTRQWQPHESQLLERISTQMAIAIQQALLLKQISDLNSTLEQQVADRTAQLEQRMGEVQELSRFQHFFLHAITHDLRTSVLGNLMVLQAITADAKETITLPADLLERMRQGTECQLHKLDALQDIYAAKTMGIALNPTMTSLSNVVAQATSELALPLQHNHAQLTVDIPDSLPTLWVDLELIQQVLRQLIANAIDHNAPGVGITVSAQQMETGVCCWVEDNGKGICPERCARLFELCVDCPESRHYGGISLGLYRCRQIIEAHHGSIQVESQLGQGARLEFTIPCASLT